MLLCLAFAKTVLQWRHYRPLQDLGWQLLGAFWGFYCLWISHIIVSRACHNCNTCRDWKTLPALEAFPHHTLCAGPNGVDKDSSKKRAGHGQHRGPISDLHLPICRCVPYSKAHLPSSWCHFLHPKSELASLYGQMLEALLALDMFLHVLDCNYQSCGKKQLFEMQYGNPH